jgi:hypothetical protein
MSLGKDEQPLAKRRGKCQLPVIASEAKQSSAASEGPLDCFVATLLAMTEDE